VKFNIVGLGEVLWDLLPGGRQMGGAPANFTCHARALGAGACLISRVGNDDLGHEIIVRLDTLGVQTDSIALDALRPTGTVSVELNGGQPRYLIHEKVAWDFIETTPSALAAVGAADAVCFGTLAQRSEPTRSTLLSLVSAAPPPALRIFDVNLRQNYFSSRLINESLAFANVLKLNDAELPQLAAMFDLSGDERSQIRQLAERNLLRVVACTRGERGSLLYSDGRWSAHPGLPANVVDTVGAGDSFTAVLTLGLLEGWDLDHINETANRVAAFVCSQPGATPPLPSHLRQLFEPTTTHA
jgi:fructokinase